MSIVDFIISKFQSLFGTEKFRVPLSNVLAKEYSQGLRVSELEFNMNFVPEDSDLSFLEDYVLRTVNDSTTRLTASLRGEISRAVLDGASKSELKARVSEVLNTKEAKNRLKTILRTETLRANNMGSLRGAKQSGLSLKKWVDVISDGSTSEVCKKINHKYGSPQRAIPISNDFLVTHENKRIKQQTPPFHPNCRSVVRFVTIGGID